MSEFRLTTIEEMEAATARLLERAEKLALPHGSFV